MELEHRLDSTTSYIEANVAYLGRIARDSTSTTTSDNVEPDARSEIETLEIENAATDGLNVEDEEIEYPEGGTQAWLVTIGSFIGLIAVFGLLNSIGSIQAYISTNQLANVSSLSTSWVFAVFSSVSYLGGIFGGILFDEFGTKIPMVVGSVLFLLGLLGTANATTLIQFIMTFGLIAGLGASICVVPLIGVVSHWFKEKRARAAGFASLGGSVGGIIFPIMLRRLYDTIGYVWAIRLFTLISAVCLMVSFVMIKERLSRPRRFNSSIQDESLSKRLQFGLLNVWVYMANTVDFGALKDPKFLFCVLATLFSEICVMNTLTYFGSYAIAVGVSQTKAYLMITVLNLAGILGRAIPGILADPYGPYNVSCVMIGVVGVLELVVWRGFGQSELALWAFVVLYGFFAATVQSLTPVCCGAICDTRDFGRRYATNYVFTGLATLVSVPIAGAIIGKGSVGNYNNFIIFTALLGIVGDVFWIIARYFIVGMKLRVRV